MLQLLFWQAGHEHLLDHQSLGRWMALRAVDTVRRAPRERLQLKPAPPDGCEGVLPSLQPGTEPRLRLYVPDTRQWCVSHAGYSCYRERQLKQAIPHTGDPSSRDLSCHGGAPRQRTGEQHTRRQERSSMLGRLSPQHNRSAGWPLVAKSCTASTEHGAIHAGHCQGAQRRRHTFVVTSHASMTQWACTHHSHFASPAALLPGHTEQRKRTSPKHRMSTL